MIFANKTSKFAEKSHAKRLILQFCTTKNVLFCKIDKSKVHKIPHMSRQQGIHCAQT